MTMTQEQFLDALDKLDALDAQDEETRRFRDKSRRLQEVGRAKAEMEKEYSRMPLGEGGEFDPAVAGMEVANFVGMGTTEEDETGRPKVSLPAKAYGAMEALRPMGLLGKHFERPEQAGLGFGERYEQGKQRYLDELGASREQSPGSAYAGGVGGVIGSSVIPGGRTAMAGRGATTMLGKAGMGALEAGKAGLVGGGLAGAGTGTGVEESVEKGVTGAGAGGLLGLLLGGGAGLAGGLASRAAGKIFDPAGKLGRLVGAAEGPGAAPRAAPESPGEAPGTPSPTGQGGLQTALSVAEKMPMPWYAKAGLWGAKKLLKPASKAELTQTPDWLTPTAEEPMGPPAPSGTEVAPSPESGQIKKWTVPTDAPQTTRPLSVDELRQEMSIGKPEWLMGPSEMPPAQEATQSLVPEETSFPDTEIDVGDGDILQSQPDDLDLYVDPVGSVGKSRPFSSPEPFKSDITEPDIGMDPIDDGAPDLERAQIKKESGASVAATPRAKKKAVDKTEEGIPFIEDPDEEIALIGQQRKETKGKPNVSELHRLLTSTERRYKVRDEAREAPEVKEGGAWAKGVQTQTAMDAKAHGSRIAELARSEDMVPEVVMWAESQKPRSQREFKEMTGLSWEHEIEPILIQRGSDLNQYPKDHRVRSKFAKKAKDIAKEALDIAKQGIEEIKDPKGPKGMAVIPGWKKPGGPKPTQAPKQSPKQVGPDPNVKGPAADDPYLKARIKKADKNHPGGIGEAYHVGSDGEVYRDTVDAGGELYYEKLDPSKGWVEASNVDPFDLTEVYPYSDETAQAPVKTGSRVPDEQDIRAIDPSFGTLKGDTVHEYVDVDGVIYRNTWDIGDRDRYVEKWDGKQWVEYPWNGDDDPVWNVFDTGEQTLVDHSDEYDDDLQPI